MIYRLYSLKRFSRVIGILIAIWFCSVASVAVAWPAAMEVPQERLDGDAGNDSTNNAGPSGPQNTQTISSDSGKLTQNPFETKLTRMPAHTAMRGLMDSEEYKKMFKGMITSQVPVMFQTMMMVENGAATGYMGSLQSVSALLDGSIQTAQLEFNLRGAHGRESQKQFVNAIYEGLNRSENKDMDHAWTLGLYYASGDKISEDLTPNYKLTKQYTRNADGGATLVQQLPENRRPNGGPNGGESASMYNVSDVLFPVGLGTGQDAQAQEQKRYFKEVIGDIKFEKVGNSDPSDPTVLFKATYIKPEKRATVKKTPGSESGDRGDRFSVPDEVFGVNVKWEDVRQETWKDMYRLLGAYCEFKKTNGNKGLELFSKEFVSGWVRTVDSKLLEKVSSPNLKVSLNLIDQIFKIWVQTTTDATQPTKIACNFDNAEEEMPDTAEPNENGDGDSCDGAQKAKRCRRNKALYRLVDVLSLDKVIEQAQATYEAAMIGAMTADVSTAEYVNQLFCSSLVAHQHSSSSQSQCNIGFWFDSMAGLNRQRWSDQLEATAKLAQSLGGSSNFRFQPNNSLTATGGAFDSAGDVEPGDGGGS